MHSHTRHSGKRRTRRAGKSKDGAEKPVKEAGKKQLVVVHSRPRNYVTIVRESRIWRNTWIRAVMSSIKMREVTIYRVTYFYEFLSIINENFVFNRLVKKTCQLNLA